MTVEQLIEALEAMPMDYEVGISAQRTNGILDAVSVQRMELPHISLECDPYVLIKTE